MGTALAPTLHDMANGVGSDGTFFVADKTAGHPLVDNRRAGVCALNSLLKLVVPFRFLSKSVALVGTVGVTVACSKSPAPPSREQQTNVAHEFNMGLQDRPIDKSFLDKPPPKLIAVVLGAPLAADDLPNAKASVSLHDENENAFCSGAFIADNLLVTASHCLARQTQMSLRREQTFFMSISSDGAIACMGGYCAHDAPASSDLGILYAEEKSNWHFEPANYQGKNFPPMILFGFGNHGVLNPRAVCSASFVSGYGLDQSTITRDGDSGGALVAIMGDERVPNAPPAPEDVIILGVAAATNGGSYMYFTPMPSSLPSLSSYPGSMPRVRTIDEKGPFRKINGCN